MSFLYNKNKQFLNSMKMFFETLNKRRQCVTYLYTYTCNKMAVPWRYPLNVTIQSNTRMNSECMLRRYHNRCMYGLLMVA